MTKSDLQRARLDLLMKQAELLCLSGSDIDYNFVERSLEPAFEYLDTLEANADYGPLKACDICGGEIKAEWDKTHKAEPKLTDVNTGTEFTASLAPHFKKELPRVCVETGKPLPEWATGTTIDYDGRVFAWEDTPLYYEESGSGEWLLVGGQYGYLGKKPQVYGPDARATWREYPKADK